MMSQKGKAMAHKPIVLELIHISVLRRTMPLIKERVYHLSLPSHVGERIIGQKARRVRVHSGTNDANRGVYHIPGKCHNIMWLSYRERCVPHNTRTMWYSFCVLGTLKC